MGLRITDVKITPGYTWGDVQRANKWETVADTQLSWGTLTQTSHTGGEVKIEVDVREINWLDICTDYRTWADVKNRFSSWLSINNYK